MVCCGTPMLHAHQQLMNGTALKHRGSATIWRHQGDWLQHSSDDPSCTSGRRHKQAVPPHSRHMSCSVDPPSATGTQLDHGLKTAVTTMHPAALTSIAMLHSLLAMDAGLQGASCDPGAVRLRMAPADQEQLQGPAQSAKQALSRACSASLSSCSLPPLRTASQPHSTQMPGANCAGFPI